jgi:hypothetical protein
MSPRTWDSSPAASLLAQPAQLTISVSRFGPKILIMPSRGTKFLLGFWANERHLIG